MMARERRWRNGVRVTVGCMALGLLTAAAAQAQPAGRTVWDGVFTQAQAARGKAAYDQTCAACHGASLAGVDVAPSLSGLRFLSAWGGTTAGELFDRIHTTMPQTDPGSLSGRMVSDIEAYIFEANGFPAGATELPTDSARMQQVRIVANKPGG